MLFHMNHAGFSQVPIFGIVGYKNVGKTTLAAKIIREWTRQGRRVAAIKHDAHEFFAHPPNTDTAVHRKSGAVATVIVNSHGHVAIDRQETVQPALEDLVRQVGDVDVVLVEGFKYAPIPKWILLQEMSAQQAAYPIPNFMKDAAFPPLILGLVVPAPPLTIENSQKGRFPVYHRDDLTGIMERMEQFQNTLQ